MTWLIIFNAFSFSCTRAYTKDGKSIQMNVKVGDKVLVPEYGGTKLTFEEKVHSLPSLNLIVLIFLPPPPPLFLQDYYLFRDGDILGVFDS